ncbi:conserved hypothetical protein [Leishmania braziliensis MHOM/BR/75/M2904]|uniref:Uncharacterized protein n=2 Tax=Leishmania braziliensis TaxID=5660 RepID=A4HLF8_LEIBR|nr:conserved hypothetical protein [Leishmania braziliensis MHOM/BR/75/M2904]KAI5686951.1 hypothetical protein MNV84_06985 [Leishmania braziliensis]CAJ2479399.1 unnamed protein product [Leishmania braziliensis]CAJ2479779.1 unnamed protein product [Leishmania braziliensis]CAM40654.1 conserved hypothetical protein [Leishmania braziliensis MHOM/BR/75/M2904]
MYVRAQTRRGEPKGQKEAQPTMDGGDSVFYEDAVLCSDEEEVKDDTPQATLKLLADFPEPLTEPQRRAVQRYVSQKVREYEVVRYQVAVVEKGYLALLRLVKRLRREVAELTASLTEGVNTSDASTPTAAASVSISPAAPTAATSAVSATKEGTTAAKRRSVGLLLRSSVFSSLQRVLQAAQTEQLDEKAEQLARQRERIARESRLHLVSQDLVSQEALLEPLQRKYARAVALGAAAAEEVTPLLTLLEDMWRLEALYPSRFSMVARGTLQLLLGDGTHEGEGNRAEEEVLVDPDDDAGRTAARSAAAVSFLVPFTPAQYTPDIEDLVRAQVEVVIDEYLAYRTRMDPVLYQLEQSQQLAKAKKVDQLMDAIGIAGTESGIEVLPMGSAAAVLHDERGGVLVKTPQHMMDISSDDEDDDQAHTGVTIGGGAADADRHDREQIQTALTALDDFEDT